MFHFTYKISNPATGEYYYGKHSTDNVNDGYMSSGNWVPSLTEEARKGLVKEIVNYYESSELAYEAEKILIGDYWKTDPLCKNEKPGGHQSFFERATYKRYCMDKHGVGHHMKLEEFRNGPTLPFRRDDVQQKCHETLVKKYGARGSASLDLKQKIESGNVEKYGTKHTLHLNHVKTAREQACLEKYGVTNPFQSADFQKSLVNPMTIPEVREKHAKSMKDKDWTDRNEKSKQTNLQKYGVTNPANRPEVRERNYVSCPFCERRYDAGNFTNHMSKTHSWTKDQIKEYRDAYKKNSS